MADQQGDGAQDAAALAREVAIRTAVSVTVQMGVLIAISWAVQNQETVRRWGRRAVQLARRDRAPGDAGLQVAEFAADVSRISHEGVSE